MIAGTWRGLRWEIPVEPLSSLCMVRQEQGGNFAVYHATASKCGVRLIGVDGQDTVTAPINPAEASRIGPVT